MVQKSLRDVALEALEAESWAREATEQETKKAFLKGRQHEHAESRSSPGYQFEVDYYKKGKPVPLKHDPTKFEHSVYPLKPTKTGFRAFDSLANAHKTLNQHLNDYGSIDAADLVEAGARLMVGDETGPLEVFTKAGGTHAPYRVNVKRLSKDQAQGCPPRLQMLASPND